MNGHRKHRYVVSRIHDDELGNSEIVKIALELVKNWIFIFGPTSSSSPELEWFLEKEKAQFESK